MRAKKLMVITAGFAAAALTLAGCAGGSDTGSGSGEGGDALFDVATDVSLTDSPTYDTMVADDVVKIGVKEDQPGLGYLDAATGERTGFDIEIAQWIAASLGFSADKIEYTPIASANREQAIVNGDVDYYVGTYSITDKRKEQIGFAGPYFETGQQLLVAADDDAITGPDDLSADTTVCSVTGSTPIQNIKDNYAGVPTEEFDTYSQCVDALRDGNVDAVTTDGAILIGYAAQYPDELKVVGDTFSTELYGVGLAKDDTALRTFVNDMFTEGGDTWQAIYDDTLGASGTEVEQPAVDQY